MGHQIATIALGPLLYLQGRRVRSRIERLPEAPGPREGERGSGPLLRLLVTGDSAGAGVGAPDQESALLGRIVAPLSEHCTVRWRLVARSGATTADTLLRLREIGDARFDAVVTSLGVNDITSGVGLGTWARRQAALRRLLRGLGARVLVVSGLPPVHGFPALPQPLRWYLGRRARQFDRRLQADVAAEPGVCFISLRFTEDPGLMASDGFHPGPPVYAEWGRRAAAAVLGPVGPNPFL